MLPSDIIPESEAQKGQRTQGTSQRPDIIFHIPSKLSGKRVNEGNAIVIALKRKANAGRAMEDFNKMDAMFDKLKYPVGIFINIDTEDTCLASYSGPFRERLHAISVKLKDGVPFIKHEFFDGKDIVSAIADNGNDDVAASDSEEHLLVKDEGTRPERSLRLDFLRESFGEEKYIAFQGAVAALAYEEARLSYLNGQFLGSILLCQTALEHELAGFLRMAGFDDSNASFYTVLREALSAHLVSQEEYDFFDKYRVYRNCYTHPNVKMDEKNPTMRALNEGKSVPKMMEDDARQLMRMTMRLIDRMPFSHR